MHIVISYWPRPHNHPPDLVLFLPYTLLDVAQEGVGGLLTLKSQFVLSGDNSPMHTLEMHEPCKYNAPQIQRKEADNGIRFAVEVATLQLKQYEILGNPVIYS